MLLGIFWEVPAYAKVASSSLGAAELAVSRTSTVRTAAPDSRLVETVSVSNAAQSLAHNVVLIETLRDAAGAPVYSERFDLGDIAPGDEAEVRYQLFFRERAMPGTYAFISAVSASNVAPLQTVDGSLQVTAPAPALREFEASASSLAPYLPRVVGARISQVVRASRGSPLRDPIAEQSLRAGAPLQKAADPGILFALLYMLLTAGVAAFGRALHRMGSAAAG